MAGHNPVKQAASSIIGDDLKPTTPPMPDNLESAKPTTHSFHRINIRPQHDGSVLVQHTPKRQPKPGQSDDTGPMDDYDNEVSTSHPTVEAAHQHLGKLMGVGGHAAPTHGATPHNPNPHIPTGK